VRGQDVYALVWLKGGGYVTEFGQDGQLEGRTKLELPFFVQVLHLAVFKSDEYLVVGLTGTIGENAPHLRTPFTAVFAADGRQRSGCHPGTSCQFRNANRLRRHRTLPAMSNKDPQHSSE
jgi:hypothetical protein